MKCLLNEISKTKVLSLESNITSLLNSITKPESKKGGSPSLNLHSIKPVNDTKVSATCVGASVTGIISTIVKIDLLEEAEEKNSKSTGTKVSKKLKNTVKFPPLQVSKTTNFTPSDELTYLTQFSKKEIVLSNDVMDPKEKDIIEKSYGKK